MTDGRVFTATGLVLGKVVRTADLVEQSIAISGSEFRNGTGPIAIAH